jgi:hypothetical protein
LGGFAAGNVEMNIPVFAKELGIFGITYTHSSEPQAHPALRQPQMTSATFKMTHYWQA